MLGTKPFNFVYFILVILLFTMTVYGENPVFKSYMDVQYGKHERNTLNFWEARGDGPRPVLVLIHGGGWTKGGKTNSVSGGRPFLEKGISYVTINYRLSSDAPLPAPVLDAARAIQFLRSQAEDWNIDREKIALSGGSAGGCSSLWIALHEDIADPDADDPVLRESSRVTAAAVGNAQTSIDPKVVEDWLGPNVLKHRMIWTSVGAVNITEAVKNYDKYQHLYVKFSPYNHLTGDDPPIMLTYTHSMTLPSKNANHGIHHPVHGMKLKEKSDELGHECHVIVQDGPRYSDYANTQDFLIDKLLNSK